MSPDDAVYLIHMLETARKAAAKAEGLDFERFLADENLHLACVHLVQVIGEAASRLRRDSCEVPRCALATGDRHAAPGGA